MNRYGCYAEAVVGRTLEFEGWEILKRGWPDFLAMKDGKIRLIEVKKNCFQAPSRHQKKMAAILKKLTGLEVEVISPDYSNTGAAFQETEEEE